MNGMCGCAGKQVLDATEPLGESEVSKPEWGFDVPPEQVDMERIRRELLEVPSFLARAYLERLEIEAPITFARFHEWLTAQTNHVVGADKEMGDEE